MSGLKFHFEGRADILTKGWQVGSEGKGGKNGACEAWSDHLCHPLWRRAGDVGGRAELGTPARGQAVGCPGRQGSALLRSSGES